MVFVNTLFGCLATVNERYSFEPLWQPAFLSKLSAEDRCHLNGLAMDQGQPRCVTVCSQSDLVGGWRQHWVSGGCVVDVPTSEIICEGLSMPHSPRFYRDRLWLLDSGSDHFGYVDIESGKLEPITFCPGYARGLAFRDNYAVVGLSKCRQERTFSVLPLEENLSLRKGIARCGTSQIAGI